MTGICKVTNSLIQSRRMANSNRRIAQICVTSTQRDKTIEHLKGYKLNDTMVLY